MSSIQRSAEAYCSDIGCNFTIFVMRPPVLKVPVCNWTLEQHSCKAFVGPDFLWQKSWGKRQSFFELAFCLVNSTTLQKAITTNLALSCKHRFMKCLPRGPRYLVACGQLRTQGPLPGTTRYRAFSFDSGAMCCVAYRKPLNSISTCRHTILNAMGPTCLGDGTKSHL